MSKRESTADGCGFLILLALCLVMVAFIMWLILRPPARPYYSTDPSRHEGFPDFLDGRR